MKHPLFTAALCLLAISVSMGLVAQDSNSGPDSPRSEFKHAINVCPIAPVFGVYAVNYEYLFNPKHGILIRGEYEDVPKSYTDADIKSNGMAFSLNYRRHLAEKMNSYFLGVYSRYRIYEGCGIMDNEKFDFTLPSFTVGLNGGRRWVWNSGFNIVASLGYGYSVDDREATPTSESIESSLDQLEKDYDFISPFFGELSVGYAF